MAADRFPDSAVASADPRLAGLGCDQAGHGEPARLLLTGWCSSRHRWASALPLLAQRRRVVSFEWRGHGDSRDAGGDFTTADMVEDALHVIEAAGLHTVIPCSASHSGWVAIELRRRLGERVPAIVHLDWMVVEPSPAYMDLIRELQDSQWWPEAKASLFDIWRGGVERPDIEQALAVMDRQGAEMWMRSGREIEAAYRREQSPLRALAAISPPPMVRHVYGQPPAPEYLEAQSRYAAEHGWFSVRHLEGVRTHFSMLEAPDAVAAEIEDVAACAASA